jgi:gas vesicle protein
VALRTKTRRDKVRAAVHDARDSVQPAAETALDKVSTATEQIVSTVAENVGPALADAKDASAEFTKETVKPAVDDAKDKVLETYKDTIVPLAAAAVVEGKKRGRKAAVKLGVAEEPKKSHKFRNFVILVGLGAVAAYVYTKVTGKDADPAWTQSRDAAATRPSHAVRPDDSTASTASTGPVDGSDTAPTAPLPSEETVESTSPTTPDKPLKKKTV